MSEQHPNPQWELIKAKMDGLRLRARFAADGFIHDTKYKMIVPPEKQKEASTTAEVFAGEVMDFIKDNPSGKLKAVQPTREQLSLVYYLLDSVADGSLLLEKTEGRVNNDRPYLVKVYRAGQPQEESGDLTSQLTELFTKKSATFVVRWDVNKGFPLGFTIFGDIGLSLPKTMDFLTLPQKAETPAQIEEHLGTNSKKCKVGVYQNGERIIFNRETVYQGKEYSMTDQYYLVGAFDGEGTGKIYWVYGKNDDKHHKMTVREGVGVRQFAPENSKS